MKTCRFITQERGFFGHSSWFNMQFRSEKNCLCTEQIMQNLARSRYPTDVLHIFNLSTSTCIYTCNAHALMSAIVWTQLFSLLRPFFFHGFLTEFSRTLGVFVDTFGVFVDTFGVLLTETSRIFHGSFAFSTAAQRLRKLTMFVVCKWKKSLNIWSKSRKQRVDLLKRPMFSKIAVFFATEHGFSTHEPLIFMLYVIKNWSYILQKTNKKKHTWEHVW